MSEMNRIAPAHNPPYIAAMRLLGEQLPEIPLVAAFETGFHATIPDRSRYYAIPKSWSDQYQVKKFGFHGASHRYIGGRIAEILGREGVCVRAGHHCAQVLMKRLGVAATTRASFAVHSTHDDVDRLVAGLAKVEEIFA
jgi:hypothetical protein